MAQSGKMLHNFPNLKTIAANSLICWTLSTQMANAAWLFPVEHIVSGADPTAVVVDDINDDGFLDIVTANDPAGSIGKVNVILSDNGDGFITAVEYDVGSRPFALAVGDINNDTFKDIVTANFNGGSVTVLLGQSNGDFAAGSEYIAGSNQAAVALCDMNGDTKMDIVTGDYFGGFSVLLAQANGTFSKDTNFLTSSYAVGGSCVGSTSNTKLTGGLAVTDLNDDGRLDISAVGTNSGVANVTLSQSSGGYATTSYSVGAGATSLVIEDVNNDEFPDIAVANAVTGIVSLLSGQTDATFATTTYLITGKNPDSLAIADMNNDRRLDIVTTNYDSGDVSVLLGEAWGVFSTATNYTMGFDFALTSVTIADMNNDTAPDIIATHNLQSSPDYSSVSILLGDPEGGMFTGTQRAVGLTPESVTVADVNGDGRSDVVTANAGDNTVSVLLNQANGDLATSKSYSTVDTSPLRDAGLLPSGVATGDINGDGRIDIVTANGNSDDVSVLLGQAGGGFATASTYLVDSAPTSIAIADLNGDGRSDIITANVNAGTISVLLGQKSGDFATAENYTVGTSPNSLAVVDVNNDGRLDIVTSLQQNQVGILLGQTGGSFAALSTYSIAGYSSFIAVGDINGDNRPDIVAANDSVTDNISVLLNQGEGGFATAVNYMIDSVASPDAIAIGDVTNDGKQDVVITGGFGLAVLSTDTNGNLNAPRHFQLNSQQHDSLVIDDVNGDGRMDVVVADKTNNNVEVLLNLDTAPAPMTNGGTSNKDNVESNNSSGSSMSVLGLLVLLAGFGMVRMRNEGTCQ